MRGLQTSRSTSSRSPRPAVAADPQRILASARNLSRFDPTIQPDRMNVIPGAFPWQTTPSPSPSPASSFAALYEKTAMGGPLPPVSFRPNWVSMRKTQLVWSDPMGAMRPCRPMTPTCLNGEMESGRLASFCIQPRCRVPMASVNSGLRPGPLSTGS